ncbi:amidase [Hyphomonas sp. WL0036]|uniref:amidase n=1 Tax=Hyphomonas sediminis TaxID=2866160 RepID=UPI001C813A21|nr:amidase [Hyphomonas sediminis]MBY9067316.1 amidase [Hyphomonas sediminis]
MSNQPDLDGLGLAALVRDRKTSAAELLEAAVERAEKAQAEINCFSALYPDLARQQIAEGGLAGPYAGVPFLVKDLGVEVKGAPVTSGSRAFQGNVASRDSTLVERFRKAGLVFFGTTTSPEFGLTLTTESTLYGQTRNPWDTTRIAGGSSGGAAAAVAAGVLPVAHASDGGGSIRIPAACCGVFGLKPSRGRMPMGPAKTEGWNGLSTVGVVSRTVRDTAALLDLTSGPETGSRYVATPQSLPYLKELERDPGPLRIALWPVAPNGTQPDADAAEGLANTVKLLESLGHTVIEAAPEIDGTALAKAALFTISANIAALVEERGMVRGHPVTDDDLEPITASMVNLGRTVPMVELAKANNTFITAAIAYERFLDAGKFDLTLSPTLHRAPDLLGTMALTAPSDQMGAAVAGFAPHCALFNQTGCPAMSVPLHWTAPTATAPAGLPIGMMFGARYGREDLLISLAGQLERAAPWAQRKPPVWVG